MTKPSRCRAQLLGCLLSPIMVLGVACGGNGDYGEIVEPGTGPANTRPLWPLGAGVLVSRVDPSSNVASVGRPRQVVISQQRTDEGRVVTVSAEALSYQPMGTLGDTLDLLETKSGDIVAIEPDGRRYLMVPATVRVGMRWRSDIPALPGAWNFAYQGIGGSKRRGGPEWTFEVESREEVQGPWGPQIVWTIVGTGPKVPHVEEDGKACYGAAPGGLDAIFCTVKSPLENVPRQGVFWRFAEGQGPLTVFNSPGGHEAIRVGGATLPELLPVVGVDAGLAGVAPAELPSLSLNPMAQPDGLKEALSEELGVFMGQSARFTASSTELAEGHAAELVLFGSGYVTTTLFDPNGQRIDDWVVDRATLCLAFDAEVNAIVPLERLADTCPDRVGPNPLSRGELEFGSAAPYVTPEGRWWARADIERMPGRGGDGINGTFERKGAHTQAPFIRDGVLHTLNCFGDEPDAPCELIAFPDDDPVLTKTSSDTTFVTGVYVWGSSGAGAAVRPGSGDSRVSGRPPNPAIRFVVPHDDGFIHVAAARPEAIIRWFSLDGRMLDYRTIPIWQPTLWHIDGKFALHDVRPLGELYRLDVTPDEVVVRGLGRFAMAAGERAEAAFRRADGRFVVVASRPAGDGRTGISLPSVYDSNITEYGMVPAIPSSLRRTLRFYVSKAPNEGAVDRVSEALAIPFWQSGPVLSFCDADGPGVSAIAVGGVEVAVSGERDSAGCGHVRVPGSVEVVAREVGVLPVAFTIDGLGVFHRHVVFSPREAVADVGLEAGEMALMTLPEAADRYTRSIRPTGSDAVCSTPYNYAQPPAPSLQTCRFEPWGRPETSVTGENTLAVCDGSEPCLDLLAFEGETAVFATHDWWVADPTNPWVVGRPELFPPRRIYWIPRERPPGPLVASDFENAVPIDRLGRHYRVVADPDAWRLPKDLSGEPAHPEDPADPPGIVGTWPEAFGLPIIEPPALDATPLLEGTGLTELPSPLQRWEGVGQTLEVFGPPLSRWLRTEVVPTARGAATRWMSGPLPDGVASALATDGVHVLWDTGLFERLDGSLVPQPEVCNGLDDDGDGSSDEAGATLCPDPDAIMSCEEGVCFRSGCVAGRTACAGNPGRCDVNLGTLSNCRGCGDVCPGYGGSECAAAGCTRARLEGVVATGDGCWRRFETGEWLRDEVHAGEWRMVAGSAYHTCRIDASGALECECQSESRDWSACRGLGRSSPLAAPVFADLPPLDRVWVGAGSSCARVAATGAVYCWGRIVDPDVIQLAEVTELAGASEIAFGGTAAYEAYGRVGGEVFVFGPVYVGSTPTWRIEKVEGLPAVTALHAANGYALFETAEGVYGLGGLGRYPAVGGPNTPTWTMPARAPGLDGALELVAIDGGPCKRTASGVYCAYRPGAYGNAPPGWTKSVEPPWLELTGDFQAAAASASRLCVVRDDIPATVFSETVRTQ